MNKREVLLRDDFFDTEKIREVRHEEDGAEILCAYLALCTCTDGGGYICNEDIPEIAAELEYDEDELRNLIERILELELGDLGGAGFWVTWPEGIE